MKNFGKKIKYIILGWVSVLCGLSCFGYVSAQVAPSYEQNFANYLVSERADSDGRVETVYNFSGVTMNKSLKDNIRCLFYPNAYGICGSSVRGGLIWGVFRYIGYALLVLFIVIVGIKLLLASGDSTKQKDALRSLIYIVYGAVLFFGATWIIGLSLGVEQLSGTQDLLYRVQGSSDSLGFKIVSLLKALAFFMAIIMVVIHGFKMMAAADKKDKAMQGIKGVINVIIALALIKVIDYLYYIALAQDFVSKATDFIIEVAKILGFIVGAALVLMIFYAGFLFITDQGSSNNMKKAKNIIVGILLVAFVLFMLLLIMYQIFAEFA